MVNTSQPSEVEFFRGIVNASQEAMLVVGVDGRIVYASPATEQIYGIDPVSLVGLPGHTGVDELDRREIQALLAKLTYSGVKRGQLTVRMMNAQTGERTPVSVDVINERGTPALDAFLFVVRDLSETLETAEELGLTRTAETLVSAITTRFANSPLENTERDLHEGLLALCGFGGIGRAELWSLDDLGRMLVPIDERHSSDLPNMPDLPGRKSFLSLAMLRNSAEHLFDGAVITATATNEFAALYEAVAVPGIVDPSISFFPMRVGGHLTGLLTISSSIEQSSWHSSVLLAVTTIASIFGIALRRRNVERNLAHQALHDPLTGLANRSLLLDRIGLALSRSARSGENVSVMLADLDGFKDINDTLGHESGDELLRQVSARLKDNLRDVDTIARLGGDEFVIVAETSTNAIHAAALASRLVEALREPISIGVQQVQLSGSVGLVIANASEDHTLDAGTILRKADIAMYRAKTSGRDRLEIFSDEMEKRIKQRFVLLDDLRRALREGEITAWFQPIIDVASRKLRSFEALVRWIHPTKGVIPPLDFIELAEGSGVVHELGAAVLDISLGQLSRWRAAGVIEPNVAMSVNVSVRQLLSMTFVDAVDETLRRYDVPPALLKLELTESIFADHHLVTGPLMRLRDLGIGVSIDDFGTGYSALSYLRNLPVDCLKIDRSFVQGLGQDRRDNALVGAVVGMAVELGLDVVAEGVETKEQLAQLSRLGCAQAQGYLFGRPSPGESFDFSKLSTESWSTIS
jgi:diguanylate cyclase (GGDEF)-like protein/PAS domain S-box-containing protein